MTKSLFHPYFLQLRQLGSSAAKLRCYFTLYGKSMDPLVYDLYIQDFVRTNKLLNQHISWDTLVSRRYVEDGKRKMFQFQTGETMEYAVGEVIVLPDAEWFCVTMKGIPISDLPTESIRLDCLRMTSQNTHYSTEVSRDGDTIIIRLMTKHRGLVNVVFVIRNNAQNIHPFLL